MSTGQRDFHPLTDAEHKQIVAARREPCPGRDGGQHASALQLADGSEIGSDDALALIDVGAVFYMIPPPGASAYDAYKATGLPLLLQTRACPDCGKRVLFA